MVSRAFLGPARRQAGGLWSDHCDCRDRVARTGRVFPGWSLVWTPRNCDSALVASARIVTSRSSRVDPKFSREIWPNESGMANLPLEWYPKTIPSRDVFPELNLHIAARKQTVADGGHMILENSAILNGSRKARFVAPESREHAEKSLVEAAKRGHSTAFGILCERCAPQLLRAAHRITRNREDSEDAVQDALLRAFVHVRDFDGRSSFSTWLTRIAINSALMILRKKRTPQEAATFAVDDFGPDGLPYEVADRAPSPEKWYAQNEEVRILKKAIRSLRSSLREAVEVQQLQERSMREAARAMSISVAAAKGRLFHAKAALRRSPILRVVHRSRSGGELRILSAA
jgi:RNA polymerase sigma factor (sigma-70 family)